MKKLIYVLLLIALGWLIKLSYDFYQVSQQLNDIQQSLHNSEQKNASLNDRLVAVQRQTDDPVQANVQKASPVQVNEPTVGVSPSVLIKQQLELVQFAIQQQQYIYALEHLTHINQSLDQYTLAEAVKQSLHQAIAQDMQSIQQFVIAKNEQQERLITLIKQIDVSLMSELKRNQLSPTKNQPEHFWQKWFQIDIIAEQSPELTNRKFILKEVQFRVLLAQQLLMKGQSVEFQEMLNHAIQQLDQLPDASSQQLKQQLIQLKQKPLLPAPKLNSIAVLGQ